MGREMDELYLTVVALAIIVTIIGGRASVVLMIQSLRDVRPNPDYIVIYRTGNLTKILKITGNDIKGVTILPHQTVLINVAQRTGTTMVQPTR